VPPYILVAGNPAGPYGLNTVGLHRAEFPPEVLTELKEAYRVIYRSNQNFSQAAEALRTLVKTEQGRRLLAFIEAPTERGIVK
jgi:UDP-N-acetylglucosamine acyltransferase